MEFQKVNGLSALYAKPIHTYKEVCSVARVHWNTSFCCQEDIGHFGVAKGCFFPIYWYSMYRQIARQMAMSV